MCKTYNTIGSLTSLKTHLENNNIYDFKSLKEVIDFRDSYTTNQKKIISHHETLIEQEKNELIQDLPKLTYEIEIKKLQEEEILVDELEKLNEKLALLLNSKPINIFQRIIQYFKVRKYRGNIKKKERNFNFEIQKRVSSLCEAQEEKTNRYQFISTQHSDAVKQSYELSMCELKRKKDVIDEISSSIFGALGEQKVVKKLEALSDDYYLINDFSVSFYKPIYNSLENEYIKSVQIDHILVGPCGVFLIETKNWSNKSLDNLKLWSPVQQIKRTSYVLFRLLNDEVSNNHLALNRHHWGDKKISIRNLIVMTNNKPNEEFQYVKILALSELLGYVNYFKPIFTNLETQTIAEYLISINE